MSSSTQTTRQLLRQWLLADEAVRTATDGAVFGAHLNSADAGTVLKGTPLVVIDLQGGFAVYTAAVQDQDFDVWCYSKMSLDKAAEVYDLCFARLQGECIKVGNVDMCGVTREVARPIDGFHDGMMAWYVRGRWTLKAVS
jgi:hypothetical protein